MAYDFKHVSETEFKVNGESVYKDMNGNWIAPQTDDTRLLKAYKNYINNLEI
jgi:hypothetical protein